MTHNCSTPAQTLNYRLRHDPCSVVINLDLMLQLQLCIPKLYSASYINNKQDRQKFL